jgi:FkbM family methyltransferase
MDISLEEYQELDPKCTVEFEGKKLIFHTPNLLTKYRADTLFTKEPGTIDWLNQIRPKEILLDIGANVGMYTIYAAQVREATVYALEPESQNYSLLNKNIRINKLDHLVSAYCVGLSDEDNFDYMFMHLLTAGDANHAVGEPLNFQLRSFNDSIEFAQGCIIYKLDTLVETKKLPIPDYIKIDVDGFEHKVIEGARKTLENKKIKSIILEINPNLPEHLATVELLKQLGFQFSQDQVNKAAYTEGPFKGMSEYVFRR